MGVSTDGILCFGFSLEEGVDLPWGSKNDINDWWEKEGGFKPKSRCPYNKDGERADWIKEKYPDKINDRHFTPPEIGEYYKEKFEWREQNPPPVEVVCHCSHDYPMYILAVKGTYISASRGYPEKITVSELNVTQEKIQELKDFCKKYKIETEEEPSWFLCSLWS